MYDEAFSRISGITLPQSNANDRARSAHHLYVIEVDFSELGLNRNSFVLEMNKHNVGGQIHYIPIHRQPYHKKKYDYKASDFPISETYYSKCLSLPIHAGLTDTEIQRVIMAVNAVIKNRDAA